MVGHQDDIDATVREKDHQKEISRTEKFEVTRAENVRRTFTEHGFSKSRLPADVYASMRTYYYNNRNNAAREEWDGKGVYVNWWKSDPYFIPPPFALKHEWQERLLPLAEEWIGGYELDITDMYGMRKYVGRGWGGGGA